MTGSTPVDWMPIVQASTPYVIGIVGIGIGVGVHRTKLAQVEIDNREARVNAERDRKSLSDTMDKLRVSVDALTVAMGVSQQSHKEFDRRITRLEDHQQGRPIR